MILSDLLELRDSTRLSRYIFSGGLIVSLVLLIWSLCMYQPAPNFYGPRAIYSLFFLSLLLVLLGRWQLLRMLKLEGAGSGGDTRNRIINAWRPMFLFDIAAPIYLASVVLIGVPAAVLVALVTQGGLQTYTALRKFISFPVASYRIGTTSLLVFLSGLAYSSIAGSSHNLYSSSPLRHLALSEEFIGVMLAAVTMMVLLAITSLPQIMRMKGDGLREAWREYSQSPVLRFQALVLSVGPLLPIVNIFDDIAAELAWLFFLVPLFAIYYLALISTRLSVRTLELQRTVEDLNSARRRQDELRDYASLVTRVQEEERRRLARELHDDTAQALIALSLGLDGLGRAITHLNLPENDREWLANLQVLADRTLEGVRRACRDLRPSVLDDLGLRAALEWLSDTSASRGVPGTFTCTGKLVTLQPEVEIAVFRIVQEALSNIWRHSGAGSANLELIYASDQLQVIIADDGVGFTPEHEDLVSNPVSQSGLGLVGMRERAMLIGASLKIYSAPGRGCTITLTYPMVHSDEQPVPSALLEI